MNFSQKKQASLPDPSHQGIRTKGTHPQPNRGVSIWPYYSEPSHKDGL